MSSQLLAFGLHWGHTLPLLVLSGAAVELCRRAGLINLAFGIQVVLAAIAFSVLIHRGDSFWLGLGATFTIGVVITALLFALKTPVDRSGVFASLIFALFLSPLIKYSLPVDAIRQTVAAASLPARLVSPTITTTLLVLGLIAAAVVPIGLEFATHRTSWGRALEWSGAGPASISRAISWRACIASIFASGALTAAIVLFDFIPNKQQLVFGYYDRLTLEALVVALVGSRSFILMIPAALGLSSIQFLAALAGAQFALPSYVYSFALCVAVVVGAFSIPRIPLSAEELV